MRLFFPFVVLFIVPQLLIAHSAGDLRATGDLRARAKAVLAQVDGEIPLAALREPVEVLRDPWGVAHIYAKNADDLFFAQGWVAAQDRLFQIDMWRRVGVGQTAEILGSSAIEADRFARLIRYRGDMKAEWTSYSPDTQAITTAFTRGINAYIDHVGDKLPIEFQILGYEPKKWQPEDVLTRMSGIIMSRNFNQEIARARLVAAVGIDKARRLAPAEPPIPYVAAPELDFNAITKDVLAGYKAATKAIEFTPPSSPLKKGAGPLGPSTSPERSSPLFQRAESASNNWVIDGSLSASGKPMLASDPHRTIAVPSLRYLVHLNAPNWNIIGSGEPGLPGVALGHNERIAWGFTIVCTDQTDIYVEKTHPDDPTRYLVGDRWEKMEIVRETIRVKGQKPVDVELRYSRHGPVIHQDAKTNLAFALKWAGSEPGGAAYLGSLGVGRAKNRSEFMEALKGWKIPCLNFMYADLDGEVGWVAAALTPVRKGWDGMLPVPGWTGTYEWQGFLPVKELPQSFNPASHWLATANHNIVPKGYRHPIAYEWAPPHRFFRIEQRLTAQTKFALEDFKSIQHETTTLPGLTLGKLLSSLKVAEPKLAERTKMLRDWNGELTRDSAVGALYAVWLAELTETFYHKPAFSKETSEALRSLNHVGMLLAALEQPTEVWFGPQPTAARDEFLLSTFVKANVRAEKLLGADSSKWRWGTLHTVTFRHALGKLGPAYEKAFDLGPVERPGDMNTPNNTRHDENFKQVHGASYRHLFDLADWDRGLATSTPGQSGQIGSPHYGDLLPLWAEGRYFPLMYSRGKVEDAAKHRLKLTPR